MPEAAGGPAVNEMHIASCRDLSALADPQTLRPASRPRTAPAEGTITITVHGTPGPQGSKSYRGSRISKRTGKSTPILVESSKKVKPWREAVAEAATEALYRLPPAQRLAFPLSGPLQAEMVFTLRPPQRIPADRYVGGVPYPAAYPDSSKLVRSTEDALTGVLWRDDAQVVLYTFVAKFYPGYGCPGSLSKPGALVRIWPIGGLK
jgi:Holliday junction resolvase RusA-like endonuclease